MKTWKKSNECCQKQLSPIDSSKVLLISLVMSPFTCCFSKEIDWKLQALESTELIRPAGEIKSVFFVFSCSTPLGGNWLWQKSTQDQTKLQRGEGSKRRKGAQPEHNLETMWHIFHFLHALEPVLSPNWQTHSRRAFNISHKISVCSHGNHWTVTAALIAG